MSQTFIYKGLKCILHNFSSLLYIYIYSLDTIASYHLITEVMCISCCRCYLQKRVLNSSRGPAVRALRAQTDKREYALEMKKIVERQVQ